MPERLGLSGNRKRVELDPRVLEPGVKFKLTWELQPGPHERTYQVTGRFIDENGDKKIILDPEGNGAPSEFRISIYEELERNGFDRIEIVDVATED